MNKIVLTAISIIIACISIFRKTYNNKFDERKYLIKGN